MDARAAATDTYDIFVTQAYPVGVEALAERARLAAATLDAHAAAELAEIDAILLEAAGAGDLLDEALAGDPSRPLAEWWWHLGAVRAGTYPADLLPDRR